MKRRPAHKRWRSEQVRRTPPVFLDAVRRLLRIRAFAWDLAATPRNAVARRFFSPANSALEQRWPRRRWMWLNPPFAAIAPWVLRSALVKIDGGGVAVLVPAGVGSDWWREYVDGKALVLFLNGRIAFVGQSNGFPQDCALLLYAPGLPAGYGVWRWREATVSFIVDVFGVRVEAQTVDDVFALVDRWRQSGLSLPSSVAALLDAPAPAKTLKEAVERSGVKKKPAAAAKKGDALEAAILAALKSGPLSTSFLARELGHGENHPKVRAACRALVEQGRVHTTGRNTGQRWVLGRGPL